MGKDSGTEVLAPLYGEQRLSRQVYGKGVGHSWEGGSHGRKGVLAGGFVNLGLKFNFKSNIWHTWQQVT